MTSQLTPANLLHQVAKAATMSPQEHAHWMNMYQYLSSTILNQLTAVEGHKLMGSMTRKIRLPFQLDQGGDFDILLLHSSVTEQYPQNYQRAWHDAVVQELEQILSIFKEFLQRDFGVDPATVMLETGFPFLKLSAPIFGNVDLVLAMGSQHSQDVVITKKLSDFEKENFGEASSYFGSVVVSAGDGAPKDEAAFISKPYELNNLYDGYDEEGANFFRNVIRIWKWWRLSHPTQLNSYQVESNFFGHFFEDHPVIKKTAESPMKGKTVDHFTFFTTLFAHRDCYHVDFLEKDLSFKLFTDTILTADSMCQKGQIEEATYLMADEFRVQITNPQA